MARIFAVLLVIMLAGCAGEAPEGTDDVVDDAESAPTIHNVTFVEGEAFAARTITGTFAPQDDPLVQAIAAATGQANTATHSHDVSDLFVVGAPTWVSINVVAPTQRGVIVSLTSPSFASIWTSDCGDCAQGAGRLWEGAVVRGTEALSLTVGYLGGSPQGASYEVNIATSSTPDWLPSGISLGIDLPQANTSIRLQGAGGTVPDVMVFGPDDALVSVLPGGASVEFVLDAGAATGEYVFHPIGHGKLYSVHMALAEGSPRARILTQDIRSEGPHAVAQNTAMTFEADRQPLQMGIMYFGRMSMEATVTLEAPSGRSVSVGNAGFVAPVGAFDQTVMGDPELGAGTYTLTWEDTANDGSIQVQEFLTFYGR